MPRKWRDIFPDVAGEEEEEEEQSVPDVTLTFQQMLDLVDKAGRRRFYGPYELRRTRECILETYYEAEGIVAGEEALRFKREVSAPLVEENSSSVVPEP